MKIYIKTLIIGLIAITITLSPQTTRAQTATNTTVRLTLSKPLPLDTLSTNTNLALLENAILESSFSLNGQLVTDFYVVNTKNKNSNLKTEYLTNRKALMADLKDDAGKEVLTQSPDFSNINIHRITVSGTKNGVDSIKKSLAILKEETLNSSGTIQKTINTTAAKEISLNTLKALSSTPMYLSVPTSGTSYFHPSSSGGRYVQQNMKWSSINFTDDQTYEHKVYLYNYDRKTYLNGASTAYPNCYPTTTYAATTWPAATKPYLDTRFAENLVSCEINELSYTIGAAQANALKAGVNYYTYMRTTNGNDTSDKFKLQAQVGFRNPSSCYTTWCAAKYKIYTLIPAWNTLVPGTKTWAYNGQVPETPSNVSVSSPTASSLKVNFTDNTFDETNTLVERKIGSGSWVSLGGFGALTGTGNYYWTNTSLAPKTTYCYRLKATNTIGSSVYSSQACGATL